jgi:polyisoprenoid-binding protein YceI
MARIVLLVLALSLPQPAAAAAWLLSPETRISVDVYWNGVRIELRFPRFAGVIEFDERDPERARADIAVDARAVDTGVGVANSVARSGPFLAAERHPQITFRLDRLVRTSPQTADVFGRITFRGVTRPLAFSARVFRYGPALDDPARFEAGFDLAGEIDRTAFGSTGGLPEVSPVLPIRIHLLMTSR